MAAITFVGSSSTSGNGVTTLAVTKPGGIQAGDIIISYSIAWMSSGTIGIPTGFSLLTDGVGNQNPTSHIYSIGYKYATGAEPSSYSFTYTATSWTIAFIYVLRNTDPGIPTNNFFALNTAPAYTATLPTASGVLGSPYDAAIHIYSGINTGATGTVTVAMSGSLSNTASQSNSSLGGVVGIGWGTNLAAPGSATASDLLDYMDFMIDIAPAPTPAAYRDKSAIVTGGNTALATLNVTIPGTIQANDLGFLCLAWVQPATDETPTVSGWTALYGSYQAQGTLRWLVFYRRYQAGDSSTITAVFGSGLGKLINAQAYWWYGAANPIILDVGGIGTRAASGGTFTTNAPSVGTSFSNETVIVMGFERTTAAETDVTSISQGTERGFVPDSGSTTCTIVVADYVQAIAPASPIVSIIYPNSQALNGAAIQIGIQGSFPMAATIAWLSM